MATNRGLMSSDAPSTSDTLTDAAIAIGDDLAKLRSSGMALYDLPESSTLFGNLDEHVSAILAVQTGGATKEAIIRPIDDQNNAMGALAVTIAARAQPDRDKAENGTAAPTYRWTE